MALEQRPIVLGTLSGLLVGLLHALLSIQGGSWTLPWQLAMWAFVGALLPIIAPAILCAYKHLLSPLGLSNVDITLPGVGNAKLALGNPQREAARKIFFEMTTRTVTQPLPDESGSLRSTMDSLYAFFNIAREELKSMPPTPSHTNSEAITLEKLGQQMLNEAIRPYTARWHVRLAEWESSGMPESEWPLHDLCRRDLERMRSLAAQFAREMGKAANIPGAQDMIPRVSSAPANSDLPEADLRELLDADAAMMKTLTARHRQAAWSCYLELLTLRSLVLTDEQSLRRQYNIVVQNLASYMHQAGPTPTQVSDDITLESVVIKAMRDISKTARTGGDHDALAARCEASAALITSHAGVRPDTANALQHHC